MSAHKPLVVTMSIAKAVITVKLIVSKCLFTSRAASLKLKQSVRSAQDELKQFHIRLISAHAIPQGGEFDKALYCGLGLTKSSKHRGRIYFFTVKTFFS